MSSYAKGTTVPVDRSVAAIRVRLAKSGCNSFGYLEEDTQEGGRGGVMWKLAGYSFRIVVPYPDATDDEIAFTPQGRKRTPAQISSERAKEIRRRWRSLELIVKAKLEAIAIGWLSLEDAFVADILLPDGLTLAESFGPRLSELASAGATHQLLPTKTQ